MIKPNSYAVIREYGNYSHSDVVDVFTSYDDAFKCYSHCVVNHTDDDDDCYSLDAFRGHLINDYDVEHLHTLHEHIVREYVED